MKRLLVAVVLLPMVSAGITGGQAHAAATTTISVRLRTAVSQLPVAKETRSGYNRGRFQLWVDADRDCQNTRAEVLIAESKARTAGACTIRTGRWFSYYDHRTFTQAADLDIDHMVPLAEAWDSGARKWNAETRTSYANDLNDPRALVAVSASANRSKSDRDPSQWMPAYHRCAYVKQWVAVKIRWSLKVDRREKRALVRHAGHCRNTVIRVSKAAIRTGGATGSGTHGGPSSGGTDPQFPYCYNAIAAGYGPYVKGRDPEYAWYNDNDHDGVVCES